MNIMSNGSFLDETNASNKQSELVKKLTATWEKKNTKAARAGGASLMALTLAACGGDDDTPFSQADVTAAEEAATAAAIAADTTPFAQADVDAAAAAATVAAQASVTEAQADAAAALVAQQAAEAAAAAAQVDAAAALVAQQSAETSAAAATVALTAAQAAQATAETDKATAEAAQATAEADLVAAQASLTTAQSDLTAKTAEYDALVTSNATLQASYDALVAPKSLTFVSTTAEVLNGGAGDDTFTGSGTAFTNADMIRDTSSTDNDTANLTVTAASTPDVTGVENINVQMNSVGALTLTASSMAGVETLTVTRGDLVVGGSTITGNKAIDINAADASDIAKIVIGGSATTVAVDQATRSGITLDADVATGNVSVLGAGTTSASGMGAGDTLTVTAVDGDAGTFASTEATENAKAVTVTSGAETVVLANDANGATADKLDGVITVTGAATKNVTIANATGGGSIDVLGEAGTLGSDGIDVVDVDNSGFSVTTSYVGGSTTQGVIDIDGTAVANQTDVATISAAGEQSVRLAAIETVNLSGNGQAVTYDINASSDVTTYAASGSHAVNLKGDLTEFDGATITGVASLDIDGGTAATINLGGMDASTAVDLGVNNSGNAITVQSGTSATITSDQTTDLEFAFKAGSTSTDLTITAGDDNGASTLVGTIDVTSFIVGGGTTAGTVTIDAVDANFNAATATTLGSAQALVVTGDEDVTLGTVTAASVNAAGSTGIINMTATTGVTSVTTGSGRDVLVLNSAATAHTLDAGAGNDDITITATNDGSLIVGGAGNDAIAASETAKAYVVDAGAGDDTVTIADINATLVGGDGTDILDVNASLDLTTTTAGSNELLAISGFETLDLNETGTQVVTLSAATFSGNNALKLDTSAGADGITVVAAAAGSTIDGSNVTMNATDTATITYTGGAGADNITGGIVGETFNQSAGNDSIEGGSTGTDILVAVGNGTDVDGSASGDVMNGNVINMGSSSIDEATITSQLGNHIGEGASAVAGGTATFTFAAGTATTTGAANIAAVQNISGIENVNGGDGEDYIVGTAGNNVFNGNAGDDYINAGDGNDTITVDGTTEYANDVYVGGLGTDTLDILATTTLSSTDLDISGIENISLSGTSTLISTGQSEAFAISIADATTTLTTGSGNDTVTLVAGTGVNTLTPLLTSGSDTVTGFAAGEDKLDLDTLGAVANTAAAGTAVNSVTHITAGAITDNSAYVISDGGLSLTAAGSQVIADYTDLTDVAAYLAEGYTSTAAADEGQFVINDVSGAKTYLYHFLEGSGGASTISDAELTLVMTITEESAAVLTVADIV